MSNRLSVHSKQFCTLPTAWEPNTSTLVLLATTFRTKTTTPDDASNISCINHEGLQRKSTYHHKNLRLYFIDGTLSIHVCSEVKQCEYAQDVICRCYKWTMRYKLNYFYTTKHIIEYCAEQSNRRTLLTISGTLDEILKIRNQSLSQIVELLLSHRTTNYQSWSCTCVFQF